MINSFSQVSRALRLLRGCNLSLIQSKDEQTLLSEICRTAVESGGYLMAWIGYAEQNAEKSIRPVAQAGYEAGYLSSNMPSWDDAVVIGRGPGGTAIRTGVCQINQDCSTNPDFAPWREEAITRGYQSSISIPLTDKNQTFGVLSLYSSEPNSFDSGEVSLLEGMASNLVFGIEVHRDRRQRKQAEEDLLIAAVAFESQEGMMITDANNVILRVNKAFTETTGYTAEEAVGKTAALLKSGRHHADFYRAMWETINRTGGWQGEIWDRRKNGEEYPKLLTISAIRNKEGIATHYLGTHFDITERKKAEEKIRNLAFFDQLTGLPNRILLLDRLMQAMSASSRNGSYGMLMLINLDNFTTLNVTQGHDIGDMLLSQVAQRLARCTHKCDTVARISGDEFVVMLTGLSASEIDAARISEEVADKILALLSVPYQLGNILYRSSGSIGVTLFRGHLTTIDDLINQADLAMNKAKEAGRNAWRLFDAQMESLVNERAALEKDLHLAIIEKQFLLHYQPQVDDDGRLTGAEALVRWEHPQRGMVSPADFIPMAEETGLILPLGKWIMETACAQLVLWASHPRMAHLTLAVNVSPRQFSHADFVDQILAILQSTGVNPQRLKLELTEGMLVENIEDVVEKMLALKARGVAFSLDDFGTGFSSLSYLKRLPLDQMKIDQSFVRDVLTNANDAAIARTVVALAQSLGLDVIAEGVETEAQRNFLAGVGCHAYQGYLFSRPLSKENFEVFAQQI